MEFDDEDIQLENARIDEVMEARADLLREELTFDDDPLGANQENFCN